VISPGSPAPDFSLRDQDGNRVGLSEFAGRRLVLAFYPADFSPGCTNQLSLYEEVVDEIEAQEASLVGVSVDSVYCHRAFRKHLNLTIPLLADFHPKGEMSRAYGAYLEDFGTTNRSLVLVGGDGVVRWSYATETPKDIPGANLIFDALANSD
jgi:peroxiredoxin